MNALDVTRDFRIRARAGSHLMLAAEFKLS